MEDTGKKSTRNWAATPSAFQRFLDWLDEGIPSNGEKYLEMRRRLVRYFEHKNCLTADDLADDTLNRVTRRLEEEGAITNVVPAQYCYTMAKFVFLEYTRRSRVEATSADAEIESLPGKSGNAIVQASDSNGELLECLEYCLQQLTSANRDLILEYYRGELKEKIQQRRQLADRLELSANALSIRACRIRDELEACTRKCSAGE